MAPSPQEMSAPVSDNQHPGLTGEEVVISGMAGLFPNSENVQEFMENLYNKVDMVSRYEPSFDHADLPEHLGKINGLHKFDANFFRVPYKQVMNMDPTAMKLLEQSYCAMYDSGVNPLFYQGKRIGVFTSAMFDEAIMILSNNQVSNEFGISGFSTTMCANRISYWLDAKGPSYGIFNVSGSTICMEHAVTCIKTGIIDAAIVGGAEFACNSTLAVNLRKAGLLSLDGKTRCFDKNGDGYVKAQSVGVLFLQKAKDAKRIYAEICCVATNFGLEKGDEHNQKRAPEKLAGFLNNVYNDLGVSPNEVEYVEANGAANPKADANELQAISEVFGKNQNQTVKVGCVKSNMGNAEATFGVCAATKLCLAYQSGRLPGNLHYEDPLDIPAIRDGKVQVLTETTEFNRGLTAINNFAFTGTDSHIVLKGHFKPKNPNIYKTDIPYLVPVSGRHESGIQKVFNILKSQRIDPELIGLLNNIYKIETPGHTCRGYTILDSKEGQTVSLAESMELYQGEHRPLWLVYSGMGSQWAGMGAELMRLPLFAAAIEKCHQILEPFGLDIVRILTSPDKTIFDNVLNSFVGIAATQIGLTNIIKEMGIVADNIIGHSLGEMGCAYYDGCITADEFILMAYTRGLVSTQTKLIKGSMAAVGLGYKDMVPLCPSEIDIACHNSAEFCTISGPADAMSAFIIELEKKGIFAKAVEAGNIAYHSRYIQDAGPEFLRVLRNIIKTPVKRSEKWITTSWPEEKWNEPAAQYSSPEYHTNNVLSAVYFEEAARLIPRNAVVVEVAPHGLMQAILKRSHPECTHIPLTKRGHSNPILFLLKAFGNLYREGYNPRVDILYPKIEYPVSTETSLLSHFVEWYHEEDWMENTKYSPYKRIKYNKINMASRTIPIFMQDGSLNFLKGHFREDNFVLPEAAVLFFVWETLAMYKGVDHKKMSVIFRNVQFHAEVIFSSVMDVVNLQICINKGNALFEVTRDNVLVANGTIDIGSFKLKQSSEIKLFTNEGSDTEFNSGDIYDILKIKGHNYKNEFKSIHSCTPDWNCSRVNMTGNWVTFLDALIQLNVLATNYDGVSVPKLIKELTIDINNHILHKMDVKESSLFDAQVCKITGVTKCGGVTMKHIIFDNRPLKETEPDVLETLSYYSQDFDDTCQNNIVRKESKNDETDETNTSNDYRLISTKSISKSGLKWEENNINTDRWVKVMFAAPSMRDIKTINNIGLFNTRNDLGMDFSGIDNSGNRVMGLVAGGALASTVVPDEDLLWPVPSHWTLEEAATVPLPYVHAYYCLLIKSTLLPSYSVFVTGGAGALGQAVISICLSLGCTVYTSVSDIKKKVFLMKLFPNLNENHIGYSNDSSFSNMVVSNSKNRRCNIVINCATGHLRELTMKCVASFGLFLDVNDYDMQLNKDLSMEYLDEDKNYRIVDISSIFKVQNIIEKKLIQKWISNGIANGTVKPISYVTYPAEDVERAFQLITFSRHRGRALIKFEKSKALPIISRLKYTSDGAYLIVCDDQVHLGVQLINHLTKLGAKKIILHQNSEKISGLIKTQQALWKERGLTVTISTEDLLSTKGINIIKEKINGIFVITLRIKEMEERYSITLAKDMSVIESLDKLSRNNWPHLNYFVVLALHSNNINDYKTTELEKICKDRAEDGLPALVVHSALIAEDIEHDKSDKDVQPVTIQTVFKAMETSLKQRHTSVAAYNKKEKLRQFSDIVLEILGMDNIDAIDENISIKDIVFEEVTIEKIRAAIKEYYKLDIPPEHVKEMKVSSLRMPKTQEKKKEVDSKLSMFYNFVDHNAIRATQTFIAMETLISWAEGKQNLYAKAVNLLLVPGFEGHHHIFRPLCERLKIRATTLQLGPDCASESIPQIALQMKQKIIGRYVLEPKFYLLGYSFGVDIALEIAALLEKDGLVGVVYCLDSSPDALRMQLNDSLGHLSEAQLQNAIISHLFHVMSGQKCSDLEDDIKKMYSWNDKVSRCIERLKGIVSYSNEYKKAVIEEFNNRIRLARSYNPEFKLESKIVLLKGISNPKVDLLPADYGLSKYSKYPVHVVDIDSDVASAPYDKTVPYILNQLFEPEILDNFKTKNLCESYNVLRN